MSDRLPKPLPTREALIALFTLEADSGRLRWKTRAEKSDEWNRRYAGQIVGINGWSHGAPRIHIDGVQYALHRVIFKIATGEEPRVIDHIDGDRSNSSPTNLRAATDYTNMQNKALYRNSTSGHANIRPDGKSWRVRFKVRGVDHNIGSFGDIDSAIRARDEAKLRLGFHPNHGRRTISRQQGAGRANNPSGENSAHA